jgi:hypothetical protein
MSPVTVSAPAESISQRDNLPNGIYTFEITGWDMKWSKAKGPDGKATDADDLNPATRSLNYNPQLKVIEDEQGNFVDEKKFNRVFFNVNSKAGWIVNDLCHGCGIDVQFLEPGNPKSPFTIPGTIDGDDTQPTLTWNFVTPLNSARFKAVIERTMSSQKEYANIKSILCTFPNCASIYPKMQHSKNLLSKTK